MPAERYFLSENDGPEREVSLREWCDAERRAGFRPKSGNGPATAGFSRWSADWQIRGRIESEAVAALSEGA